MQLRLWEQVYIKDAFLQSPYKTASTGHVEERTSSCYSHGKLISAHPMCPGLDFDLNCFDFIMVWVAGKVEFSVPFSFKVQPGLPKEPFFCCAAKRRLKRYITGGSISDQKVVCLGCTECTTLHIFLSVRNNLTNHVIDIQGKQIKWEYIERFYYMEKTRENTGLWANHKLTDKHIELPGFFQNVSASGCPNTEPLCGSWNL